MELNINDIIIKGIISGKKKNGEFEKGKLQRITINGNEAIQLSLYTKTQVFHSNYNDNTIIFKLIELLETNFNNLELTQRIIYIHIEYHLRVSFYQIKGKIMKQ